MQASALTFTGFITKPVASGKLRKFSQYLCVCGTSIVRRADQKEMPTDCGCGALELGKKYHRLTVVEKAPNYRWKFLCECGATIITSLGAVQSGHAKSCGCYNREVNHYKVGCTSAMLSHGKSTSRTYRIWSDMVTRTSNPAAKGYAYYGARGITISESWRQFENFFLDMGECPEGLTLERIDNNKGYSKENCRWASRKEQANNRRSNRLETYQGRTQTLKQWCEELGCNYQKINLRLTRLKWSLEKALTVP